MLQASKMKTKNQF